MRRTAWLVVICAVSILLPLTLILPTGHVVAAGQNSQTEIHGLNPADMDPTCKPCEDFSRLPERRLGKDSGDSTPAFTE